MLSQNSGGLLGRFYAIASAADGSWMLLVFTATILFCGLMFAGYAVFDELALYVVIVGVLLCNPRLMTQSCMAAETRLQRIHRYVFIATMVYLAVETIRGMFALGDLRVVRFTAMFVALAGIALRSSLPTPAAEVTPYRVARVVVVAVTVYFWCYLGIGLIDELLLNGWRFDEQGHIWVGTAAAFVPGIVVLPALVSLGGSTDRLDRRWYWMGFPTLCLAAFYYQSRLEWMALLVVTVATFFTGGWKRAGQLIAILLAFVIFFPWGYVYPLRPQQFIGQVTETITQMPRVQPADNLLRFASAVFGSFVHLKPHATAIIKRPAVGAGGKPLAPGQEGTEEVVVRTQEDVNTTTDIDRKLAILAAVKTVSSQGIKVLLIGTGYYSHRLVMLPYIHATANEYQYRFPESYNTIVRTATFNGMLVDNGLIGMALFLSLFVLTGVTALVMMWRRLGARLGLVLAAGGSLALVGLSLFASSNFDMLLLYLVIMPAGPVLAVIAPWRSDLKAQAG